MSRPWPPILEARRLAPHVLGKSTPTRPFAGRSPMNWSAAEQHTRCSSARRSTRAPGGAAPRLGRRRLRACAPRRRGKYQDSRAAGSEFPFHAIRLSQRLRSEVGRLERWVRRVTSEPPARMHCLVLQHILITLPWFLPPLSTVDRTLFGIHDFPPPVHALG